MEAQTLILSGLAILSPSLLQTVRGPGPALAAALALLKTTNTPGVTFTGDDSSAARTFDNMVAALPAELDHGQLDLLMALWLDAWSAGCRAGNTKTDAAGELSYGLYDPAANAMDSVSENYGGCLASSCSSEHATSTMAGVVCAVQKQRDALSGTSSSSGATDVWGIVKSGAGEGATPASDSDRAATLSVLSDLANAMDSQDRSGNALQFDNGLGGLFDVSTWLPRKIWSAVSDALGPYLWVGLAVGGFLVYRAVTK